MPMSMLSTQKSTPTKLLPPTLLTDEQEDAVEHMYGRLASVLMVPVGFGKTVISLTAIADMLEDKVIKRVLVVAPLRVCQLTWATEHLKWSHLAGLNVAMATGPAPGRTKAVNTGAEIVVVNFENVKWMLDNHGAEFDGLLIDELTKVKGGGVAYKALRKYRNKFTWCCGMTGTLVEEGLEFLYQQFRIVDGGARLGTSKERFLQRYFVPLDYNQYNWGPQHDAFKRIAAKINDITFHISEYAGRRAPLIEYAFIDLPESARLIYKKMAKDMLVEHETGETTEAANAAVKTGKLQQICSGFLYSDQHPVTAHYDKMQLVVREVEKNNTPTIIVYTFTWELEFLKAAFPYALVLGGGVSEAQADTAQSLWNAGELDVLLVHPKSAGHGLNLQYGGHRIIFTAPIWSRDQTDQVIGRLNRRGQKHQVHVTFCVARNTVEDKIIIPRVLGKGDTAQEFRRHLESC